MEYDQIEALADEALNALSLGNTEQARLLLAQVKGYASACMSLSLAWDLIRQDYERGTPPRRLVQKYAKFNLTARVISVQAHEQGWLSPLKKRKALKPPARKTIFYPNCRVCEKPFEAISGAAAICPTCKAFKAMEK